MEIDEALLDRARRALGRKTTRATIEEALRRAADTHEAEQAERAARQRTYFDGLGRRTDLSVLGSEEMWR